ncbi:MAG: hypothetical protein LUD50_07610 [Clostridia bacterium]|nr:hypothetical protein [Clostridia bacterium]
MEDDDEEQVLQTCPTLEEFTQIVKEYFECYYGSISEAALDRYFESDEARRVVGNRYKEHLEDLKNGEITTKIFRIGCAAAVGDCLAFMYEGDIY